MYISQPPQAFVLPQEIVDLIIDQVAQFHHKAERRAALRACCRVSGSFAAQATRHLWSNFEFLVDDSHRKHATRLVEVLKRADSKGRKSRLVSSVRSINILYPQNSADSLSFLGKSDRSQSLYGSIKKYFKPEYHLSDVLQILEHPKLEDFRISSTGPPRSLYTDWRWQELAIEPILLRILSRNTLKSITLSNGGHLSFKVIAAAFFSTSIEDITIRNVTYVYDHLPRRERMKYKTLAKLKRLEIRHQHISFILSKVHPFLSFPTPNSSWLDSHSMFPYLQTLAVSMPHEFSMMELLWKFISGLASTLENLDLGDYYQGYPAVAQSFPLFLCGLANLRHFKYTMACSNTVQRIKSAQLTFVKLLSPHTLTPKLRTVELGFICTHDSQFIEGHSLEAWKNSPHWGSIDARLDDSLDFSSLRRLVISLEVRYGPDARYTTHEISQEEMRASAEVMLPILLRHPSIQITLDGQIFFDSSDELHCVPALHSSL